MGLFGKKDELFEIMSRGAGRGAAASTTTPRPSEAVGRPAKASANPWKQASGAWPAPTRTSRSWRRKAEPPPEDVFLEVDGDAIVLVDDGFMDGLDAEDGPEVSIFAMRADTAVVGTLLACGLLVAAFFMGRTTTAPEGPAVNGPGEVAVVVRQAEPEAPPAPAQVAPTPTTPTPTVVPASFRPQPAPAPVEPAQPAPAQPEQPEAAVEPAPEPAPAQPKPAGNYFLNVCTTTPENGAKLAKWLNEAPRSPIFGREGLMAEVTSRGTVRIRGFLERDDEVRKRVRATVDPLGGGRAFSDAWFRAAR